MKIAVDAMGGDKAPLQIVDGILHCLPDLDDDVKLVLVGNTEEVKKAFNGRELEWENRLEYVDAPEQIEMKESPIEALRNKPNNSISVATMLVKKGMADAVFSAGNTGAMVGSASLILGKLDGVQKAGIAAVMPTPKGPSVLLDVGANVNCRAAHLVQYAAMGAVMYAKLYNKENPKVGLLSVGGESSKGNLVVKDAIYMLNESNNIKDLPFEFAGLVEGHDVMTGNYNVVICDGFTGNILLKFAEAVNEQFMSVFKNTINSLIEKKHGDTSKINGIFEEVAPKFDWSASGGAELLGISGTTMIAHGRSNKKAIASAIKICSKMVKYHIQNHIQDVINVVNTQLIKNTIKSS
ncbi:MAG: phosphate acyltransferase PlsX [Planctomycetes bacterium]|nr:phosphate acyltransferase PlsX [Planctomycetota bacterium]